MVSYVRSYLTYSHTGTLLFSSPYPQEGFTHSVNKHCWIQPLFLVLGRGNSAKCWDTEMEKAQSLPLRGFQTFG